MTSALNTSGTTKPFNDSVIIRLVGIRYEATMMSGYTGAMFFCFASFIVIIVVALFVVMVHLFFLLFTCLLLCTAGPSNKDYNAFGIGRINVSGLVRICVYVVALCGFNAKLRNTSGLFSAFWFLKLCFYYFIRRSGVARLSLLGSRILCVFLVGAFTYRIVSTEGFALRAWNIRCNNGTIWTTGAMFDVHSSRVEGKTRYLNGEFQFASTAHLGRSMIRTLRFRSFRRLLCRIDLRHATSAAVLRDCRAFLFLSRRTAFLCGIYVSIRLTCIVSSGNGLGTAFVEGSIVCRHHFTAT